MILLLINKQMMGAPSAEPQLYGKKMFPSCKHFAYSAARAFATLNL